jgi:hypothetical protein
MQNNTYTPRSIFEAINLNIVDLSKDIVLFLKKSMKYMLHYTPKWAKVIQRTK